MKIRNAIVEDSDAITKIQINAWRIAYRHFIPAEILNSLSLELRSGQWAKRIADGEGRLRVAQNNEQVIGFVHLGAIENKKIEIIRIYVAPEAQNQGVGSSLLEDVVNFASQNKVQSIYLWVAEQNRMARKFYERSGFELVKDYTRLDAFTADGSPNEQVRTIKDTPNLEKGQFLEVCYQLNL